jgi:hypothetical protein
MSRYLAKSLEAIEKNGWLLVFPIPEKKKPTGRRNSEQPPLSLWKCLFPRSEMRWEWSDDADDRVVQLWHLRREIAESKQVVYSKWFRGRATVFSFDMFQRLWVLTSYRRSNLGAEAQEVLDLLEMESPLSTKELRRGADLIGKENERRYLSAMKELWSSLAIVGIGEIDDGAFPSLAHASTATVFEEVVREAERKISPEQAEEWIRARVSDRTFLKQIGLLAVKP